MLGAFVIAIIVGLLIGLLSGLLGIGGGALMIPIFRLGFHLSAIMSTATSLFAIIPTSIAGCITHLKNRTCLPRLGVAAGIAGACLSPVGVLAANLSPAWLVMFCAGLIICYSAITMFRKGFSMPKNSHSDLSITATLRRYRMEFEDEEDQKRDREKMERALKERRELFRAEMEAAQQSVDLKMCLKGGCIGLVAGFASGYVGVGGGFIMVPFFVSLLGVSMKQASGTSLIAVAILAIPGAISQAVWGNIDYLFGIAIALGSVPGALIGASLVRSVPERSLRLCFAVILLIAAVALIVNEFTMS